MERKSIQKSYSLDPAACDEVAAQIVEFCGGLGIEKKDMLRYRLSAEECMLYWMTHGCEGNPLRLTLGRSFRAPCITIEAEGAPLDPYDEEDEEFGSFADSTLVSLGLRPAYAYEKGANRIRFRVKKKSLGQIATLGIVVLAALFAGLVGAWLVPEALRQALLSVVINPLCDTFFKTLGCIAGPMIFLSVAWGIYGVGDTATLGRIGKTMMLRYAGITAFFCLWCTVFFPLLGPGLSGGADTQGQLGSIAELVLGIFPSTIIEPFSTGNTLQIILLAVVIGIALVYLGRQTGSVARAIEQANLIVQLLMKVIGRLMPYVTFLVIVNMIWSGSIGVLVSSWRLLAVLVIALLAVAMVCLLRTSLRWKVRLTALLKKSMPTFLIALSTASSAAAFSSNVTTCEKQYGIEPSLIRFGIPLGLVMHKPATSVYNLLLVFFFAGKYGVSCSIGWLVVAVIICTVIAIATPPIPGGGAVAYSVLFAQMGIPTEALAVALAIDIVLDFLITAFEMLFLQLSLINISADLGRIDQDILVREEP